MNNLLWILFFILPFSAEIYSQEDSLVQNQVEQWEVNFEETDLEKWKQEKEFDYLVRETSTGWWTQFKGWLNAKYEELLQWIFGSYTPGSLISYLIMAIPYILLVLILAIITWLFVRLYPVYGTAERASKSADIYFSEEEKIVRSKDIQKLIKEAEKNKDYRLAIRYYFLYNLQKLDEMKIINYQPDKTNAEYKYEMGSDELRLRFGKISRFYEYIWYGDFPVSEEEFKRAQKAFLNFNNQQRKMDHE